MYIPDRYAFLPRIWLGGDIIRWRVHGTWSDRLKVHPQEQQKQHDHSEEEWWHHRLTIIAYISTAAQHNAESRVFVSLLPLTHLQLVQDFNNGSDWVALVSLGNLHFRDAHKIGVLVRLHMETERANQVITTVLGLLL